MSRRSILNRLKMRQPREQVAEGKVMTQSKLTSSLDENVATLKQLFGNPVDLVVRELSIGDSNLRAVIIYLSGMTDEKLINTNIVEAIQQNVQEFDREEPDQLKEIEKKIIAITEIERVTDLDTVLSAILYGDTIFCLDGTTEMLRLGTIGGESRSVEEPESETLIRGPREGFVENISTNLALIRRDIRDANLRFIDHVVGKISQQKLVVVYIEGLTHPELVKEVNRRVTSFDLDFLSDSSYVEQWIEDSSLSPFPQLLDTERPDKVTANLVKGKIAILVDGTPFALITPITIGDGLLSNEDYSQRWLSASLLRLLRYLTAFIGVFLPGLFVALVSYHPGMIPSNLVFSIAATREGVPFPAAVEAVLMAVTFEILHEAGVRLPKVIGQTIGIVGGLVIGEAAVSAGIVSPIMVIITALTAIAAFSIPAYSFSITFRLLRFVVLLAAGFFGLYGVVLVYIMLNIHIASLTSLGVPYSTPFAPTFLKDLKNVFFRSPITTFSSQLDYLLPDGKKLKQTSVKEKSRKK